MATPVSVLKEIAFSSISLEKKLEIKQRGRPTHKLEIVQVTKGKYRDFKREFKESLYERTSWLCGCEATNKLFCFPCLLFTKQSSENLNWIKSVSYTHLDVYKRQV